MEQRDGWFELSFMTGSVITSPVDFNAQFTDWLRKANGHRDPTLRVNWNERPT